MRAVVCEDTTDAALTLAIGDPSRVMDGPGDGGPAAFAFVFPDPAGALSTTT